MEINIVVPELGESILEATVLEWFKNEGDVVAAGDHLLSLETSKVNVEVAAEQAGRLSHILHTRGEDVKVGDVLGTLETAVVPEAKPGLPAQPAAKAPAPVAAAEAAPGHEVRATPLAQRVAHDLAVDLAQVPGTGPSGKTTRSDVEAFATKGRAEKTVAAPRTPAAPPAPAAPLPMVAGREERVRLSRRRRTIAARLVEAQHTAAMLTTFNEADMSAVMSLRQRRQDSFVARFGVKLGITSFFVKAAIGALKAFPRLNAEILGDEMILKHYYDIGIAVGAAEGLVVPVLRDADRLSFAAIEQKIKDFARQADDNSLSLEDLRGGSFTITNGGVFGSLLSTPILNPPQVGILGLHKIEKRPVVVDEAVVIRPMMYLALSYDHRIVDGMEAVQFLVRVKELIEQPEALLLEG
jgi:2-oxoglutarate dehydrogenase E2 component (dihydrolipoamide succinyltransferase)